jgi:hypothetical protein
MDRRHHHRLTLSKCDRGDAIPAGDEKDGDKRSAAHAKKIHAGELFCAARDEGKKAASASSISASERAGADFMGSAAGEFWNAQLLGFSTSLENTAEY